MCKDNDDLLIIIGNTCWFVKGHIHNIELTVKKGSTQFCPQ